MAILLYYGVAGFYFILLTVLRILERSPEP